MCLAPPSPSPAPSSLRGWSMWTHPPLSCPVGMLLAVSMTETIQPMPPVWSWTQPVCRQQTLETTPAQLVCLTLVAVDMLWTVRRCLTLSASLSVSVGSVCMCSSSCGHLSLCEYCILHRTECNSQPRLHSSTWGSPWGIVC